MSGVEATVIVPTSIDRGPLLQYSVGSVLAQTVRALEVFIIGDGVQDLTREAAHALARQDSRVRFFDHPKGSRRGETYRHQALQEARGAIVCYLCDRDLWLPDHLATMRQLLTTADFGTTLPLDIRVDGTIRTPMSSHLDLGRVDDRQHVLRERLGFQLSVVGHTLDIVPVGFRTAGGSLPRGSSRTPTCGGNFWKIQHAGLDPTSIPPCSILPGGDIRGSRPESD